MTGDGEGHGEGHGEGCPGGIVTCSLLALGVSSTALPFSFRSSARTGCLAPGLGRPSVFGLCWFGFCAAVSFFRNTASRSSSELLGSGFSFDFFLLRLAAAKMEETRRSRLQGSFPEPQEPCGTGRQQQHGGVSTANNKLLSPVWNSCTPPAPVWQRRAEGERREGHKQASVTVVSAPTLKQTQQMRQQQQQRWWWQRRRQHKG